MVEQLIATWAIGVPALSWFFFLQVGYSASNASAEDLMETLVICIFWPLTVLPMLVGAIARRVTQPSSR